MAAIGLQRRQRAAAPTRVEAFGFTPWKQRSLCRFLAGSEVIFRFPWQGLSARAEAVAVWGRRAGSHQRPTSQQYANNSTVHLISQNDSSLQRLHIPTELFPSER